MFLNLHIALLFGTLLTLAAAQTQTRLKLSTKCNDVMIFMARGNDAIYHDVRTFPFVVATCIDLFQQGISCDYIDIKYDTTRDGPYCHQVAEGTRNGIIEVIALNKACPKTKFVLNGYSEGAHVVGNVLGGPGGCGNSTGIDNNSAAGKAIAAVLLWGDPRHTANQTYNVLDGATKQSEPRTSDDLALLNRYSSVIRSYCNARDPWCAGGDNITYHLNYFDVYTYDAAAWAVYMVNKLGNSSAVMSNATAANATWERRSGPKALLAFEYVDA